MAKLAKVAKETTMLRVEISSALKQRLRVFAAAIPKPMNHVVEDAIKAYCK